MDTVVGWKPHLRASEAPAGKSSAKHRTLITRNLKLVLVNVTAEPIPERWLELVNQFEVAEDRTR